MQTIKENGKITEAYLGKKEFQAFQIISDYKDMGLPPRDLLKELNKNGITSSQKSQGLKAYKLSRNGTEIFMGKGYETKPVGYWGDLTIPSP